jgi:phage FluMu protein Com
MPIRFRCGYCNRLLGIARRKAGTETTCPHCGYTLTVPDDPTGDTTEMEDLDELLNPLTSPASQTHQPNGEFDKSVAQPRRQTKEVASNGQAHSSSGPTSSPAPTSTRSAKAHASTGSSSSSAPDTRAPGERPLFEGNLDDVLGTHTPIDESTIAKSTHVPTSGMDALSLENDRNHIVLSVQKATILAILVVILIGISFAAGYLLASSK